MCSYLISGDADDLLTMLFPTNDAGNLTFGFGATSTSPCSSGDLLSRDIDFRDYIMEGFVFYSIRAEACDKGLRVRIRKRGMNRDEYIDPNIRHFMKSHDFTIIEEPAP